MGLKHISNDTPNTLFVGGKMIPPGEGRDIDERDLPPEYREPAPEPEEAPVPGLDEELGVLLVNTVPTLKEMLPDLSHEALERLHALEAEHEHPRKTLLEAVEAELLRRANEALGTDDAGQQGADADDTNVGA